MNTAPAKPEEPKLTCGGFPITEKTKRAVDFMPYIVKLQKRIKGNWHATGSSRQERIALVFWIDCTGNISELAIKSSSGNEKANQAALQAIKDSAPFDPLPFNAPGPSLEVKFTFDYERNRF